MSHFTVQAIRSSVHLFGVAAPPTSRGRLAILVCLAVAAALAALLFPFNVARASPQPSLNPDVAPPAEIVIPSIGVDMAIEQVGDAPDGAMDVPQDPNEAAWYAPGPMPGAQGNAVIAGHVDWGGVIRPFWGLKNLQPGDTIAVIASDSTEYDFTVTGTQFYDATAPVDDVFFPGDNTALTLITCGGDFNHVTRRYMERVVVRAALQ